MKTLDKGKDRVQKICDALRKEAIEPAQKESESIIAEAQKRAQEILTEAERKKQKLIDEAKLQIEHERNVFSSSLQQASKQAVETLRQQVEHHFFNEQLAEELKAPMNDPNLLAQLISAIVRAIDKEGLAADLKVEISELVRPDDVNALLGKQILKSLEKGSVSIGDFNGGVKVKIKDKRMTVDVTEDALMELLSAYLRKDFRKLFFGPGA